jgi:hypothetical protein
LADPTDAAAAGEPASAAVPSPAVPTTYPLSERVTPEWARTDAPEVAREADAAPETAPAPHEHPLEPQHRIPRDRRPAPWGRLALVVAVLMIVVLTAALVVNAPGRYLEATVLAIVADGLSLVAVVLGIVGIVADRGRGAAIAAVVIGVLGNPLVLLYGLGALT